MKIVNDLFDDNFFTTQHLTNTQPLFKLFNLKMMKRLKGKVKLANIYCSDFFCRRYRIGFDFFGDEIELAQYIGFSR